MTAPGVAMTIDMRSAVLAAVERLAGKGVDSPRLDAELLMAHALGFAREDIFLTPDHRLSPAETGAFEALVSRRAAREPVARILAVKEFWSLEFALNEATLVPRPDSETLVTAVLEECAGKGASAPRILDLGTGCGCLLLALLSEMPGATGIGVDCDPGAVVAARDNARRLGLEDRAAFRQGDWFGALEAADNAAPFDVILSNPPYIETACIAALAPEVAGFEPAVALDGGADGLDAYRRIAAAVPEFLAPDGLVALELGAGQEKAVSQILQDSGFAPRAVYDDLAGVARVISAAPGVASAGALAGDLAANSGNE